MLETINACTVTLETEDKRSRIALSYRGPASFTVADCSTTCGEHYQLKEKFIYDYGSRVELRISCPYSGHYYNPCISKWLQTFIVAKAFTVQSNDDDMDIAPIPHATSAKTLTTLETVLPNCNVTGCERQCQCCEMCSL